MSSNKDALKQGAGIVAKATALTTQKATLIPADAEGSPDVNIQAITSTSPFGFVDAQEAITVLYTIINLQDRLAELEAIVEAAGLANTN